MSKVTAAIGITLLATTGSVVAADAQYPTKPVRVIAAFPPGGGVDIVARAVSERLSARLGQSLVVDNRPGAGTAIGTEIAVKSPADGYTLLVGPIGAALIAQIYYRKSYDMRRDLAAISKIGYGTIVLVVAPSIGVASIKELIALAKAKPGQLTFASSGTGSNIHLTGEMFKQRGGVDIVHVPYKGSALMLPDLIEGRVTMALDSMPAHLPHIKTGRLRALAVASAQRSAQLPDVPTISEAGLPGFEASSWFGMIAPAKTPKAAVDRLRSEIAAALKDPEMQNRFAASGARLVGNTPEQFGVQIAEDRARWEKVIAAAGIKLQ